MRVELLNGMFCYEAHGRSGTSGCTAAGGGGAQFASSQCDVQHGADRSTNQIAPDLRGNSLVFTILCAAHGPLPGAASGLVGGRCGSQAEQRALRSKYRVSVFVLPLSIAC